MSISIKSLDQVEKMRIAGSLAASVLEMIGEYVVVGVTTEKLDLICHDFIGNDLKSISTVISNAKEMTKQGKPIVIILHTEMGNGVDFMMGTHKWHGNAPNDEQLEIALAQNTETLGDY